MSWQYRQTTPRTSIENTQRKTKTKLALLLYFILFFLALFLNIAQFKQRYLAVVACLLTAKRVLMRFGSRIIFLKLPTKGRRDVDHGLALFGPIWLPLACQVTMRNKDNAQV